MSVLTDRLDDQLTEPAAKSVNGSIKGMWAWTVLRLLLGWSFVWAFIDKMFGFGFSTCRAADSSAIDFFCDAAMIRGGSPTYGVLEFGTQGSHTGGLFSWMAPSGPDAINFADVGFMLALLAGGVALMLGLGTRGVHALHTDANARIDLDNLPADSIAHDQEGSHRQECRAQSSVGGTDCIPDVPNPNHGWGRIPSRNLVPNGHHKHDASAEEDRRATIGLTRVNLPCAGQDERENARDPRISPILIRGGVTGHA